MSKQLWMSCIVEGIEVRAVIQHLHAHEDLGAIFSAELRITKNDRLVLRELFWDERKLHARSMQLFENLMPRSQGYEQRVYCGATPYDTVGVVANNHSARSDQY